MFQLARSVLAFTTTSLVVLVVLYLELLQVGSTDAPNVYPYKVDKIGLWAYKQGYILLHSVA